MEKPDRRRIKFLIYPAALFAAVFLLVSCELFPYGLFGDKGSLKISFIDETGTAVSPGVARIEVYELHSDNDRSYEKESSFSEKGKVDLVVSGIDPGVWYMDLIACSSGSVSTDGGIRHMKFNIYESVETSYLVQVRYNPGESRFTMTADNVSTGIPETAAVQNIDFMGHSYEGFQNLAFNIKMDVSPYSNGTMSVPETETTIVASDFTLGESGSFPAVSYYAVTDSLVAAVDTGYSTDVLNRTFGLELAGNDGSRVINCAEAPSIPGTPATISFYDFGGYQGDMFSAHFYDVGQIDCTAGIILSSTGVVQAESIYSWGYTDFIDIETTYVDRGTATVYIILYDLENENDMESGVVGTFMDQSGFNPYLDPVSHVYCRIKNVQVLSQTITIN